ncbi:hypothetical protein JWG39_10995 [Desulforhopalus vacuolatus]|uniref:hypothetical protein n=1 Tax=Desulforhopalus vacuolatus TaxID=40414 RepID=UPI00196588AA|nr:hypothetical protein [Desulforhopalus vacuolatus]MBM9520337.1 hypothetical protein [Desulforhopalus vacuolatus]
MVKNILSIVLVLTLFGCADVQIDNNCQFVDSEEICLGSSTLPNNIANKFEAVKDKTLLNKALGSPQKGALCQGQVYKSKKGSKIILYRAWNSTNPRSKLGQWWAFNKPLGEISKYRSDYEICYQWSPLDKLVRCTLKDDIKVVVGTGQSAECSEYLTYPVSDKQQIYIDDPANSLIDCTIFSGEFNWK